MRDAAIKPEPHTEIGDIGLRDQHRHADRDLRRPFLGRSVVSTGAARRRDRLFQHVLIELDTDLADMAGLLVAEKIAGAADIEIVARQLEAGAERIQGLHDVEAALRRRRKFFLLG